MLEEAYELKSIGPQVLRGAMEVGGLIAMKQWDSGVLGCYEDRHTATRHLERRKSGP